jgi:hypothetical protein
MSSCKQEEGKYQKHKHKREGDLAGPFPSVAITATAAGVAHLQLGSMEDALNPLLDWMLTEEGESRDWQTKNLNLGLVLNSTERQSRGRKSHFHLAF